MSIWLFVKQQVGGHVGCSVFNLRSYSYVGFIADCRVHNSTSHCHQYSQHAGTNRWEKQCYCWIQLRKNCRVGVHVYRQFLSDLNCMHLMQMLSSPQISSMSSSSHCPTFCLAFFMLWTQAVSLLSPLLWDCHRLSCQLQKLLCRLEQHSFLLMWWTVQILTQTFLKQCKECRVLLYIIEGWYAGISI